MKIVVKIGSSLILEKNKVNLKPLSKVVKQIADLKKSGHQIIVVSSGAIVLGRKMGFSKKWPENLVGKQALAALGQPKLMSIYQKFFEKYGLSVAQILLTRDDIFSDRYLKVKNTLFTLFKKTLNLYFFLFNHFNLIYFINLRLLYNKYLNREKVI